MRRTAVQLRLADLTVYADVFQVSSAPSTGFVRRRYFAVPRASGVFSVRRSRVEVHVALSTLQRYLHSNSVFPRPIWKMADGKDWQGATRSQFFDLRPGDSNQALRCKLKGLSVNLGISPHLSISLGSDNSHLRFFRANNAIVTVMVKVLTSARIISK